jgi:hypothetical protein
VGSLKPMLSPSMLLVISLRNFEMSNGLPMVLPF